MSVDENRGGAPEGLREQAVRRLNKRRDFYRHLFIYIVFNGLCVALWAATDRHGFFWPVFLMGVWGIGLVFNAWDVYRGDDWTERQIQREIERRSGTG